MLILDQQNVHHLHPILDMLNRHSFTLLTTPTPRLTLLLRGDIIKAMGRHLADLS